MNDGVEVFALPPRLTRALATASSADLDELAGRADRSCGQATTPTHAAARRRTEQGLALAKPKNAQAKDLGAHRWTL